ncbi:protein ECT2-like isoform X1 [Dermacentor andersoni]|uniref:protein ECT2-like isoform X1 n=1 Tax=Dermacentor andersoni TaxID=34620 RepID=UPI002155584E|nr:protein ECT2-like isoform X1 [Dermacentor andersoni]
MANESSIVGGSFSSNGFNANDTLSCRGYTKQRICLVGSLKDNEKVVQAAKCQGLPVVHSESGAEYAGDRGTVFVVERFEGPLFEQLKQRSLVLSSLLIVQCAERSMPFPDKGRPIYNLSMDGLVIVFTGFKSRTELCELLLLSHYMGASVRDKFSSRNVTHCVADSVTSAKYELCDALDIPIMKKEWLLEAWAHRDEKDFSVTSESMMKLRLEAFRGLQLAFLGFADDERQHMEEVALANGAHVVEPTDAGCHFLVVDDSNPVAPVVPTDISPKVQVVKSEWFWASIQHARCFMAGAYYYEHQAPMVAATPLRPSLGAPRSESKRRKLRESLAQQLAQEAEQSVLVDPFSPESPRHRRRVSANKSVSVLDISLTPEKQLATVLDTEGQENKEPSDMTRMSKRQQVCLELLQTETNYVAILHSILTLFKAPLEDPSSMAGEPLLDSAEVRLIFGHLPPIYEVHRSLQLQLQAMLRTWSDDHAVGEAVLAHREAFEKAYPPFVNSFERAKETLAQCDRQRPRFHAFLKRCQTKPECGRQTLAELMIRPIQRLGSMILLLKEIQKRTPKNNKDSEALEKAVAALNQIMLNINEGKRKTESQVAMFDIFNDIEKCPPNILSGHRYFVTSLDVVEIGEGGLSRKGDAVSLFLFSDILEVCRRRSRAVLTSRSPASSTLGRSGFPKTYKHIVMVHLYDVKRVVELTSTEDSDVKDAFGLVLRLPTEPRENLYTFVAEQSAPWRDFLCTLCQHMGKVYNVPDHSAFMKKMSVQELGLDPSSLQTTLAKALKYAAKKGEKLSRALSITRRAATPRHRLSRAVSTFISPLKSVTNQSSPLHGMRLASSSNLNDLADDSPCSSPQRGAPQVRVKSGSYGPSTSKRA